MHAAGAFGAGELHRGHARDGQLHAEHGVAQPHPQLPGDVVHRVRAGLHHDPDHEGVAVDRFQPPDLGLLDDAGAPLRILREALCSGEQRVLDRGDVRVGRHAEIDDRASPALRHVADPGDLAVAHVPEGAVRVAHLRDAHADVLDDAGGETQVDHVADSDLILGHEEHAVQDVLDDVLGAETEARADGGGEQGQGPQERVVDDVHDQDDRDHHEDHVDDVLQDRAERPRALHESHVGERRALQGSGVGDLRLGLGTGDDPAYDAADGEPQHEGECRADDDDESSLQSLAADGEKGTRQLLPPLGDVGGRIHGDDIHRSRSYDRGLGGF